MFAVVEYTQHVDSWGWRVIALIQSEDRGWGFLEACVATSEGVLLQHHTGNFRRTPDAVIKECWDLIDWCASAEIAKGLVEEAMSRAW